MTYPEIKHKVIVVTGAAQGIGEAITHLFSELEATVAALDIQVDKLRQSQANVAIYPVDVTQSHVVEATIEQVEHDLGPIDILVNVAGILHLSPVIDLSDEAWAKTFAVNSSGVFYVSRAVARYMVPRQTGSIITVGSNAGRLPRMGMAAYAASKAASAMFTKCLGLELAPHYIRCNLVSPGSTDTDMQRALWHDESGPQAVIRGSLETFRTGIPLGRIATPHDIAEVVVFLASDRARHITMQDICVDGGAILGV